MSVYLLTIYCVFLNCDIIALASSKKNDISINVNYNTINEGFTILYYPFHPIRFNHKEKRNIS